MKTYKTAQIAGMIGVHPNTIQFYEEMKLIPVIPRNESGYRIFNDRHLAQLRLLRTALVSGGTLTFYIYYISLVNKQ